MQKPDKPQTTLRKSPKQGRSKELVDSVLEAATRIFNGVDSKNINTNRIAELAGISIGSLYQYFPGKDAITAKLIEHQMELHAKEFQELIDANEGQSPNEITKLLIDKVVDNFFAKRVMFSALFAETPRLQKTREVISRRNKNLVVFFEFFSKHREQLRYPEKVDEMVYVFAHSAVGVLQVAALENFESHTPDVLKKHLKEMAIRFLFVD